MKTITLLGGNARAELKANEMPFVYSPVFNSEEWNLDVFNYPSNMIPVDVTRSEMGILSLVMEHANNMPIKERLLFVFSRKENYAHNRTLKDGEPLDLGEWSLPFQHMSQSLFHAAEQIVPFSFAPESSTVQAAVIHVWRNEDFECKGHPEILRGYPMGMFHCEYCGAMNIAGVGHISNEAQDEIDAELNALCEDHDAALDEGFALPAEDENQDAENEKQ